MPLHSISHISDTALVAELQRLVRCERHTTVALITHLAEFDARRLYRGAGFPSLFVYCIEVLRLSESAAYSCIEAARAARKFPRVLDLLGQASLNLTSVKLLARKLTKENHETLLTEACGKSKRAVEELLARHFPQPDAPSLVRKLPAPAPMPEVPTPAAAVVAAAMPSVTAPPPADSAGPAFLSAVAAPPTAPRPAVRPLAPDRYHVSFTTSAATCEKLRVAKDLLRHAVPTGDTGEIVDRALTALIEELTRKKFAATKRPRASRGTTPASRAIPSKVKREVVVRDGGRCAFVGKGGRRCNTRAFIEFHHIEPYGVGGEATVDNISLRCRAHNGYEADLFYGPGKYPGGDGVVREPVQTYGPVRSGATRPGTSWRGPVPRADRAASAAPVSAPETCGIRAL
jgi:hypothetical protein